MPPRLDPSNDTARRPNASQTLTRGLEIVESVAAGAVSLPEIAKYTGLSQSTAHRLASALVEARYLQHEPRRGYGLGSKLIELGFQAYRGSSILVAARPYLEQLATQTLNTVHLATLVNDEVIYLDKLPGQRPIEVSSYIGGRNPITTTGVGKALILDCDEDEWRRIHAREAQAGHNVPAEAAWLDLMRSSAARGCAFDLGEAEPAIRCVAAPVRDATGRIVAAISVTSVVQYMEPERMEALVPVVKAQAEAISVQLGWRSR
ncbi:IclR family transcriptional regulator [Paraburkholderia unamae]|uniref:IclR family transcriptional regulator n=1 Tax=Paraburkholderia unamae TaxID=219649 RepID=A0ABX5KI38_9BURK|nr:IclR family transcriptional regulator [Paraburkholderia unamae]PVX81101.1 IclR family transcriptional regulator [Paraburkholderia unamae]RAR53287.1 IclR family transcriptional regulator [Paraburkholderia unamae]